MFCEAESCVFVRNKSIIKMFLILKCCFWLKYQSSSHNIAFSSEKVILSESGEKYAQIKHHLQAKTVQNSSKQICLILIWENNNMMDFFTGRIIIMDYEWYFGQKRQFKVKTH